MSLPLSEDNLPLARTAGNTFARVALDLKHRPFPELAIALRERCGRILSRWHELSFKAMPHANRLTLEEFENSIAKILSAVADALQSEDPQQLRLLIEEAPTHGLDRFIQEVGLLDYFEEERILRGVIITELSEYLQRPLEVGEAATFHALFDIMIQQGALALVQKEKERTLQTEAALRESQHFLRSSLDALAGNIAILDESGTILEVNASWRRFASQNHFAGNDCGVGSNYFEPCALSSADHQSARNEGAAIVQGIREVIAGHRAGFEIEYPCHSPTEQRWFLMRATRFQGSGAARVVIVHDNITERKNAEAAQLELAERFAEQSRVVDRVLSSITDFAYTFDLEGRFTFANKPLLDLWGVTLEQAVGKNFHDLNYPTDLAVKLQNEIKQVIDSGRPLVGETPYISPTGVIGFYQYIFSPVPASDRTIGAVAGSTRDITEQKRVEEQLRLSIVERDALLAREQDARADAEAANHAKDRFVAVLSHELRTPLTPVVMTVAALELNPDLPPHVREDLKMIRRNVELESKLIDDLLDINRIASGKLPLQVDIVHVNELIQHVCDMCRSNFREKSIHLSCDLQPDTRPVVGDAARLHQVFWNLLINAAKFTPEGGSVSINSANSGSGNVRIAVRDSGIGIPPEVLPRIFDAFEQGDAGITRQFGGMGLGLSISKLLVDQHGGSIRAETAGPGEGSTFIVELPAATREETAKQPAKSPAADQGVATLRVLVVEDHVDTAAALRKLLTAKGHSVMTATTVAAALALAGAHPFDILVSDLGLPDATGYDLMREIKAKYGIKGIAMSGYGMEDDIRKSEQAGFSHHMVKPVSISHLEQAIRRVAANR